MASAPRRETPAVTDRVNWLRQNIEGDAENLFSPNYVNRAPWHNEQIRSQANTMFSKYRFTVEDMIESGDKVVVRWRLRGTWAKPFLNIDATNKPVDFTGITIYRFEGDKIVESDGEFDLAGLSAQALAAGVTAQRCQEALQVLSRVNPSPV